MSYAVVTWDHREQPKWGEVNDAIRQAFNGSLCPRVYEVDDTGSDQYAIVVSGEPLSMLDLDAIFDEFLLTGNGVGEGGQPVSKPKVEYLPTQCVGCHRFPWAKVDGVPYCGPHGQQAIDRIKRAEVVSDDGAE